MLIMGVILELGQRCDESMNNNCTVHFIVGHDLHMGAEFQLTLSQLLSEK